MFQKWLHISRDLNKEGSFVQNAAWMFSSSGTSIVLQFVFFYLLSKIYDPTDYGLFGIFNVYAATLGNLASFGYNQAFVLPQEDDKFKHLLQLTIAISTAVCAFFALVMVCIGEWTLAAFGHQQLGWYLHLVAPVAWLMALDRISSDWAIRAKSFKNQMWTSVTATVISRSYNLAHGLLIAPNALGLVLTTLCQHALRIGLYVRFVIPAPAQLNWNKWNVRGMVTMAKTYKRYPTFVHWSNVLVIFSASLPAAMLPLYGYSLEDIGYYVHALVLLDIPIRLMGAGIASVFTQKAAEIVRDRPHELWAHSYALFKNMCWIALAFLCVVLVWGQWGYGLVFGLAWQPAGLLAEVLVLHFFFRMISSPLSALFFVLQAEKQNFYFHAALTLGRVLCLWITASNCCSFMVVMWWYGLVNALFYLIYLALLLRLLHGPVLRILTQTIGLTLIVLLLSLGLRYMLFGSLGPLLTSPW